MAIASAVGKCQWSLVLNENMETISVKLKNFLNKIVPYLLSSCYLLAL